MVREWASNTQLSDHHTNDNINRQRRQLETKRHDDDER